MLRTYVRVDLRLHGPWAVGAWQVGDGTREEAARRGVLRAPQGGEAPELPGSGLAGSLRAHLAREGSAVDLMGPEPPGDRRAAHEATASPWWVLGVRLTEQAGEVTTATRTAIDRRRRAPRSGSLRTEELVVPVGDGPHLSVYLMWEDTLTPGSTAARDRMLEALPGWRPAIGRGRGVGMGRAALSGGVSRTFDTDDPADLKALLLTPGGGPARIDALLRGGAPLRPAGSRGEDDVVLRAVLEFPDGICLSGPDDETRKTVDGSTWKGLLRSRVEFVGRSVGAEPAPCDVTTGCGECDVCAAFGSSAAAGLLEFDISAVDRTDATVRERSRVAIDRFTGGYRDGALFRSREEVGVRLTLVVRLLGPEVPAWVGRALLHALRDIDDGLVGVGMHTGIGLGTARVTVSLGPAAQTLGLSGKVGSGTRFAEAFDACPVLA